MTMAMFLMDVRTATVLSTESAALRAHKETNVWAYTGDCVLAGRGFVVTAATTKDVTTTICAARTSTQYHASFRGGLVVTRIRVKWRIIIIQFGCDTCVIARSAARISLAEPDPII